MRSLIVPMLLLLTAPADASELITYGDSWAEGGSDELQDALRAAGLSGLTHSNRGIIGTTTEYWVTTQPLELVYAVDANPDAEWIWISLGGNDVIDGRLNGMSSAEIVSQVDQNLRTLLDALFAIHARVQVVMFGYDYTNFDHIDCPEQRDTIFGTGLDQSQVNAIFRSEVGDVQAAVAADYPNVTFVPIYGSMQIAGGGSENAAAPSPANLMQDCIHPNTDGYRAVMDALVMSFWTGPSPTAEVTADGTPPCVGDTITFDSSGSTQVDHRLWLVDGREAARQVSLALQLTTPGSRSVELLTYNESRSASDVRTIAVVDCNAPDAGVMDQGTADASPPDVSPPDVGNLIWDGGPRESDAGAGRDATPSNALDSGTFGGQGRGRTGCQSARGGDFFWLLLLPLLHPSLRRRRSACRSRMR